MLQSPLWSGGTEQVWREVRGASQRWGQGSLLEVSVMADTVVTLVAIQVRDQGLPDGHGAGQGRPLPQAVPLVRNLQVSSLPNILMSSVQISKVLCPMSTVHQPEEVPVQPTQDGSQPGELQLRRGRRHLLPELLLNQVV